MKNSFYPRGHCYRHCFQIIELSGRQLYAPDKHQALNYKMKHTVLSNLIEQGQRDPDSIIRAALDIQALALLLELQFNPVSNGYYDT